MKARLIIRDRRVFEDGCLIEVLIWKTPVPVPPTDHGLKYRLFYGRKGERIIGYDNERGKGDHRHYGGREEPYVFTTMEQLLDEFERDVIAVRGGAI
jgi:hypothetical protein